MTDFPFQFTKYDEDEVDNLNKYANTIDKVEFRTDNIKIVPVGKIKLLDKSVDRTETMSNIAKLIKDIESAILIEAGIFEFTLVYCSMKNFIDEMLVAVYNDKVYDILENLDPGNVVGNSTLIKLIEEEQIDPQIIAFMKPQDMYPKRWGDIKRKLDLREYKKKNMAVTDLYTCRKCGERKCKFYEAQHSKADEAFTRYITCVNCYHVMKFR